MERRRRHGTRFLIPAGILIGLGIGIILNNPFPFLMIGLGFGFLGSSFEKHQDVSPADSVTPIERTKHRWSTVILGLFFIIFGITLAAAPDISWTYIIAGMLILLGIWFVARATGKDF